MIFPLTMPLACITITSLSANHKVILHHPPHTCKLRCCSLIFSLFEVRRSLSARDGAYEYLRLCSQNQRILRLYEHGCEVTRWRRGRYEGDHQGGRGIGAWFAPYAAELPSNRLTKDSLYRSNRDCRAIKLGERQALELFCVGQP